MVKYKDIPLYETIGKKNCMNIYIEKQFMNEHATSIERLAIGSLGGQISESIPQQISSHM